MVRIFATFLKKGSAKNFFSKKVLGYFSKIVRSTFISSTPRRYSGNRFFMKLLTEEWVKIAFSCKRRLFYLPTVHL